MDKLVSADMLGFRDYLRSEDYADPAFCRAENCSFALTPLTESNPTRPKQGFAVKGFGKRWRAVSEGSTNPADVLNKE